MSKLRIGSIMEFDSTKSRREAYNCGRKQGAVEELKRIKSFIRIREKEITNNKSYSNFTKISKLKETTNIITECSKSLLNKEKGVFEK
jgi:hypothetical protein